LQVCRSLNSNTPFFINTSHHTYSHIALAGLHEDLERLERIIVKDYKQEAKGHKEKLQQNHRVRKRMDEMQGIARKLVSVTLHCCQQQCAGETFRGSHTCWCGAAAG
jgi:hypothetical protein